MCGQIPHYAYSRAALYRSLVSFGLNINNSVGQLEYTAGLDTTAIAGGVSSGVHGAADLHTSLDFFL